MGKTTGFLDYSRKNGGYRSVAERLKDYREFTSPLPGDELANQGARCMDCGIPYCHAMGCPIYNLIPEWNDAVYRGEWQEALRRLEATNTLPEITGRVCPAPCETACTLSINKAPVTIKQIELAIIENGFRQGWIVPCPPKRETGRRVAIIGSGPAGLSAAQVLRRAGHDVTVFEKDAKAGGILRYGIPDFKLEKHIIDRRIAQMSAEGVKFETNVLIGEDLSVRYLRRSFDAILLTMGAGEPRDLTVPGRGLEGIHFAMDYLKQSNRLVANEPVSEKIISARDKIVIVIGGGDTGSDCVGTANRQGARKVYQFEIMPKPIVWNEPYNPDWPLWPNILRTSSSQEEGCERDWSVQTLRFSGSGVKVAEGQFARIEWKSDPATGSQSMTELSGGEFTIKVDLVLLAMGFLHTNHNRLTEDLGVELDQRGNIRFDGDYCSSVKSVFVAGDSGTGASLVVRAIYHGREAAKKVDEYLRG
ncbi:MAG: glutamate synthase subunit beta [Chitinispirillaceae bacterium]|jgi:glutamate synthase (NADPH/NADH) small chain|nr:glutamate synthase subunit beta [Chitinispirillaceae bacterium]